MVCTCLIREVKQLPFTAALGSTDNRQWLQAIEKEFDTIQESETWIPVKNVESGATVHSSGTVLRIKTVLDSEHSFSQVQTSRV